MARRFTFVTVLLAALVLALSPTAQAKAKYELRFNHVLGPTHPTTPGS